LQAGHADSGASGCVRSHTRQRSVAVVTFPPLLLVLVGGAGEEGRLAQTRAHDKDLDPKKEGARHGPAL
jgi:hypothetical protein